MMPYIDEAGRHAIDHDGYRPETEGELNYAITRLIDRYVQDRSLSYASINAVLGVLEGVKLEFYRRVAAPYEDRKMATNGDVYYHRHVPNA